MKITMSEIQLNFTTHAKQENTTYKKKNIQSIIIIDKRLRCKICQSGYYKYSPNTQEGRGKRKHNKKNTKI